MKSVFLLFAMILFAGCTAKEPATTPEREPEVTEKPGPTEDDSEKPLTMVIEGDLGTIDEAMVQRKFQESRDKVSECLHNNLQHNDFVGGTFHFMFRIGLDGTVRRLEMKSAVGHRDIETCIYNFAKSIQFPKPEGGEAQVTYSWSFNATMDHQHDWDARRLGNAWSGLRSKLIRCSDGSEAAPSEYTVIFFVLPDAELGPLGISSGKILVSDKFHQCVHRAVKGTKLPDPLGAVARVVLNISP